MMDWPQEKILLLLNAYKNSTILWDSREQNYYNTSKKIDAWQEIAKKMDVSREECKKKMESLKASYRREKAKTRRSNPSGSGEDGWKSRWFAFEAMKFLDEVSGPRETTSGWNSDYSEELGDDGLETNHQPPPKMTKTQKLSNKRKIEQSHHPGNQHDASHAVMDASYLHHYYKPAGDVDPEAVRTECTTFGAYVASKLRNYSVRERAIAQHRIASVFFDIDMAMYSVDTPLQHPMTSGGGGAVTNAGLSHNFSTQDEDDHVHNLTVKVRESECSNSS